MDRAKCDIQHIALQWELLHWASNNHKHRAYYSSPVEVCNAMGAINKRQKVTTWGGDRHSTHNSTNHYHDENIREYQARSLHFQTETLRLFPRSLFFLLLSNKLVVCIFLPFFGFSRSLLYFTYYGRLLFLILWRLWA